MKVFCENIDWNNRGDVFLFSVIPDHELCDILELLFIYKEITPKDTKIVFYGTEYFEFDIDDYIKFCERARDITFNEIDVFRKFNVTGFNIFEIIKTHLRDWIYRYDAIYYNKYISRYITQKDLDRIKLVYSRLFGKEQFDELQRLFNNK